MTILNDNQIKVISHLIGLVKVFENSEASYNDKILVINTLKSIDDVNALNEEKTNKIIDILNNKKLELSPSCKLCSMPCGRTDNLDEQELKGLSNVSKIKIRIIKSIIDYLNKEENIIVNEETINDILYTLFTISYQDDKDSLSKLCVKF